MQFIWEVVLENKSGREWGSEMGKGYKLRNGVRMTFMGNGAQSHWSPSKNPWETYLRVNLLEE